MVSVNLTNFITIGLIAFAAVFLANKGLEAAGKSEFKA